MTTCDDRCMKMIEIKALKSKLFIAENFQMTQEEIVSIKEPIEGLEVFNKTYKQYQFYDGDYWFVAQ